MSLPNQYYKSRQPAKPKPPPEDPIRWFDWIIYICAVIVIFLTLFVAFGCGKPATAMVPVFTDCGPMPPEVVACYKTLSASATDAELVRCWRISVTELEADNAILRAKYAPCAKGTPPPAPVEPPKAKHWWNHG